MIDTLTLNNNISRPELFGHSNLAFLPEKAPDNFLFSLEAKNGINTEVKIKSVTIGGPEIILMAGPCSLENQEQMKISALAAKHAGAKILRGGAFKPRTSPYSFQGLGESGLIIWKEIADDLNMLVVSEATGEKNLQIVAKYCDIIQIGARNSQNFELLASAGEIANKLGKAILYKRGPWMSIKDWMLATEYILATGCKDVILCERGTNMDNGEYGLDTSGITKLRNITHLPVIADPTHSAKIASEVPGIALAGISSGADGLIIEIHPNPEQAKSDGPRALLPEDLYGLSREISSRLPIGRYFS